MDLDRGRQRATAKKNKRFARTYLGVVLASALYRPNDDIVETVSVDISATSDRKAAVVTCIGSVDGDATGAEARQLDDPWQRNHRCQQSGRQTRHSVQPVCNGHQRQCGLL